MVAAMRLAFLVLFACSGETTVAEAPPVPAPEQVEVMPEPVEVTPSTPPPRFPRMGAARLIRGSEPGTWAVYWHPAHGANEYSVILGERELGRVDADTRTYELGALPEAEQVVTVVAHNDGGESRLQLDIPEGEYRREAIAVPGPREVAAILAQPFEVPAETTQRVVESRRRGRVRADPPESLGPGSFDPQIVYRMFRARVATFRRCYESVLRDSSAEGAVTIEFQITERGLVQGARIVQDTSANAALSSCVQSSVRRFRFPEGDESTSFRATLHFAPA